MGFKVLGVRVYTGFRIQGGVCIRCHMYTLRTPQEPYIHPHPRPHITSYELQSIFPTSFDGHKLLFEAYLRTLLKHKRDHVHWVNLLLTVPHIRFWVGSFGVER